MFRSGLNTQRVLRSCKRVLATASLVSIFTGGAISASANASVKTPDTATTNIAVAYIPNSGSELGLYTAIEHGFFTRNHLNVTLIGVSAATGPSVLASGSTQFLLTGGEVAPQLQFPDLKIIGLTGSTRDYLFAPSSEHVTKVSELAGKSVAISAAGGTFDLFTKYALTQAGVDATKVYVGSVPAILPAVLKGAVAAGVGNYANLQAALADGMTEIPVPDPYNNPGSVASFIGVDESWAHTHRAQTTAFLTALSEADGWVMEKKNKAAAEETIVNDLLVPQDEAAAYYAIDAPHGFTVMTCPAWVVLYAENDLEQPGLTADAYPPRSFIDNSYLPKKFPELYAGEKQVGAVKPS
jgi:ABC-type nitrate/sulfonate/bicarbonate transport system substrate-binding protein